MKHVLTEVADKLIASKDYALLGRMIVAALRDMETTPAPKQGDDDSAALLTHNEKLAETLAQLRKTKTELVKANTRTETARDDVKIERAANERMAADNNWLHGQIRQLKAEIERTDIEQLKKTIATQEAMIAERHRHIDRLADQNRELRKKIALLEIGTPAPAPAPTQDNIADQPIPASDETDAPEPEQLITAAELFGSLDEAVKVSEAQEIAPAFTTERLPLRRRAPTSVAVIVEGVSFAAPGTVAAVLVHILNNPGTTASEIVDAGHCETRETAKATIAKARALLQDASDGALTIACTGQRGDKTPGLYRIARVHRAEDQNTQTPSPGIPPSVQSEGEAGSSPGQDDAAREAGEGAVQHTSQASSFVTSPEPGEGVTSPVDSAPAADGGRIARLAPLEPFLDIPPGKLIAVCLKTRRVATPDGTYKVDGAPLAKALHALARINDDQVLGLDQIARVAGWKDADVAKTALAFEALRLKVRGVEIFMDKFNARLRAA